MVKTDMTAMEKDLAKEMSKEMDDLWKAYARDSESPTKPPQGESGLHGLVSGANGLTTRPSVGMPTVSTLPATWRPGPVLGAATAPGNESASLSARHGAHGLEIVPETTLDVSHASSPDLSAQRTSGGFRHKLREVRRSGRSSARQEGSGPRSRRRSTGGRSASPHSLLLEERPRSHVDPNPFFLPRPEVNSKRALADPCGAEADSPSTTRPAGLLGDTPTAGSRERSGEGEYARLLLGEQKYTAKFRDNTEGSLEP